MAMLAYKKTEARDWAREKLIGVANVVIPTMTADFKRLNEAAIRHDVEKTIEHGFAGTLACSEVAMSMDEYGQLCRVIVEQAAGRLLVFHHAVFNTFEDNIEALRLAERAGADIILLGYPPYMNPKSLDDIYAYTKAFCDATDLAVMLFPVPGWGFRPFHPADFPLPLLRRLIDDCPNIVSIKAEGGMPYIMSLIETYRHLKDEVVISVPLEHEYTPLAQVMNIPFCGTNFSAYYGPWLPKVHQLIQAGEYDEATQIFYQLDPARRAYGAVPQVGGGLINRMVWKYEGWLQGYNGGPLRHPTGRIFHRDMAALRRGQEMSGMDPTKDSDDDFYVGRCPE
jgi:4-hydroxy-tetrahydrodipicolinate synthase